MEAVDEIKSRLDIADAVQEYLPLKPAGSGSFKGLCPFHHEKTPSFYVNRPRQSWHCFGCDQGGDVISFVMKMEGLEFREALEFLAGKTGVTLPAFDAQKSSDKKRLVEVNDLASRWFRSILLSAPAAEHARAYVAKRAIDDLTGDIWRIGYAPESWSALRDVLTVKGVTEDELVRAGLAGKREQGSGVYDRFRDRVMFSIFDVHGNVVGFTGRILNDATKEAKYVNTPETLTYKKSMVLYGLDKAKGEIKRSDLAVIVEGNMDVVSSHRVGVTNVVASSGTALTQEQLGLLKRFTKNLAIAFDQDAAGNAATLRGLDLARALDFNVRVITLPPEAGKDPDDVVRNNPDLWRDAIKNAKPIIEWLYQNAFRHHPSSTPESKKMIARDLLPEFRRIPDPVERDSWIGRLGKDLAVSPDALRDALRTTASTASSSVRTPVQPSSSIPPSPVTPIPKSREEQLAERILAILQVKPELQPLADSRLKGYNLAQHQIEGRAGYLSILADREFEDQSSAALERELIDTISVLVVKDRASRLQQLVQDMQEAELVGDRDRVDELTQQFNQLNS